MEKFGTESKATDDNLIRCIVCWITKATDTYLEYVIPFAFPRKQCAHERAINLRYTYTSCMVTMEEECVLCDVRRLEL